MLRISTSVSLLHTSSLRTYPYPPPPSNPSSTTALHLPFSLPTLLNSILSNATILTPTRAHPKLLIIDAKTPWQTTAFLPYLLSSTPPARRCNRPYSLLSNTITPHTLPSSPSSPTPPLSIHPLTFYPGPQKQRLPPSTRAPIVIKRVLPGLPCLMKCGMFFSWGWDSGIGTVGGEVRAIGWEDLEGKSRIEGGLGGDVWS